MNMRQIAWQNLWHNRQRYLAYLLSVAFSVMVFFMYSALIYHPALKSGFRAAAYARIGMQAAAVVIAAFTFLFLLYSNSAFVRARKKEFGLLTLMGVTRLQLSGMVLWESLAVGALALLLGVSSGLLGLWLFFPAVSTLPSLPAPIPYLIAPAAWLQTLAVFGSFFLLVALFALKDLVRGSIIQLIRAERQPRAAPSFSRWRAMLGVGLLLLGYIWTSIPSGGIVLIGVIPVTAMVSIGTFLVLREASIALLQRLRSRGSFFYRTGPMLTVSRLSFKIQENYRVLSAVAVTVAVILTAMGTITSLFAVVAGDATQESPISFQLVQTGAAPAADRTAALQAVEAAFAEHGLTTPDRRELVTGEALLGEGDNRQPVRLMPYSLYTSLRQGRKSLPLEGEATAIRTLAYVPAYGQDLPGPMALELHLSGRVWPLTVVVDPVGPILNPGEAKPEVLVVADSLFAHVMAGLPNDQRVIYSLWQAEDWKGKASVDITRQLHQAFPAGSFSTTLDAYQREVGSFGIVLFIGLFVSLVFFVSICAIPYFRLFTDAEEDRRYYRRLRELGLSVGELRRVSRQQARVLFFLPFLLGLLHSTFAMQALGTVVRQTVLHLGWMVALGYLLLYGLFFAATHGAYWRSLAVAREMRA